MRRILQLAGVVAVVLVTAAPAFQNPPYHSPEMDEAIGQITRARDRLAGEEQQLANGPPNPDRLKEVQRRRANLDAILAVFPRTRMVFEFPLQRNTDPIAVARDDTEPAQIIVDDTLREGMSPEALAQHIAHEAVHLIIRNRTNSIDEEYRAFLKEAEVWQELKLANPALVDRECDENLALILRGEAATKANLRQRDGYNGLPENSRPR